MPDYTLVGWGDGTGPRAYPGLIQMDNGILANSAAINSTNSNVAALQRLTPVDTVAALQAATGTSVGESCLLLGYTAVGDGGGGQVRRTASGLTVNGVTVFSCADGGSARWERVLQDRTLSVKQAGARSTNDVADSSSVASANATAFTAFANVLSAMTTANGSAIGIVPPERFYIQMPEGGTLWAFSSIEGLTLIMHGTILYDRHKDTGYAADTYASFMTLYTVKRFKLLGMPKIITMVAPTWNIPGISKGLQIIRAYQGCEDMDIEIDSDGGIQGFFTQRATTDPDSWHTKNLRARIKSHNTFYPLALADSGKNVVADVISDTDGRAFDIYGVKDVVLNVDAKNQKVESVLGDDGTGGSENITINYRNRESTATNVTPVHMTCSTITPTTFRNIRWNLDIRNPPTGGWQWSMYLEKRNPASGDTLDDVGRGHTLENVSIEGMIEHLGSGATFIEWGVSGSTSLWTSPDAMKNVDLSRLVLKGTGTLNIAAPYTAQFSPPPGYSVATSQTLTTNGTIALPTQPRDILPVTSAAAVTGIILAVGKYDTQVITVLNRSANSITFAAVGTSNVAAGAGAIIAAGEAARFLWDANYAGAGAGRWVSIGA